MIPASYWKHLDTPMKHSPTGNAMQRIHELYPELTVHQCLERARQALDLAAARKRYKVTILSQEQEAKSKEAHRVWLEKIKNKSHRTSGNAKSGHPGRVPQAHGHTA